MIVKLLSLIAILAPSLSLSTLAYGQTTPAPNSATNTATIYNGITGQQLLNIVQNKGYRATLSSDSGGDPQILSETEGTKYFISFYGCDKGVQRTCKSVQFTVAWNNDIGFTVTDCNQFNIQYRFAHLTMLDQKSVELTYDVTLDGASDSLISSVLDSWDVSVSLANQFTAKKH